MSTKYAMMTALGCLLLTGCKVGPNYHPPVEVTPEEWAETPEAAVCVEEEAPLANWWNVLNDPLLTSYIEMAAYHNYNVKTAEANILQARAMRQIAASTLFPFLSADANATHFYFSKNGPLFSLTQTPGQIRATPAPGSAFTAQIPQTQNLYNATLDATWELDLFGKTRRKIEAAEAGYESAIEQRSDILISVFAEVARNYIEIRSAQQNARLIQQNVKLLEDNTQIVLGRVKSGLTNRLDAERIEADLANLRSQLPDIEAQIYRGIYALSVLTGQFPETFLEELLPDGDLPEIPAEVAVGLPGDLLRRRPDVRKAERNLAQATANIGVAVAQLFPTITLSGAIGFQSLKLNNLFQNASKTWNYGGDINQPIFQGGALMGNLDANKAEAFAAEAIYQQTVLGAIQEAESALVSLKQEVTTSNELKISSGKTRNVWDLTKQRYTSGLIGMTDLLDSERQLIATEQNLLNSQTNALLDLIALYKALGGGWEVFPYPCHDSCIWKKL